MRGIFCLPLGGILDVRSVVSDVSGSFVLKVINALLLFLLSVVLARWLGPDEYGSYAFVLSCVSIALVPVHFGIPGLLVREVAKGARLDAWGTVRGAIRTAWGAVAALALVLVCVLGGMIFAFGMDDASRANAFLLALLLLPLTGLNQVRQAVLRGFHRIVTGQLPEMLVVPLVMLLGALLLQQWLAPSAASGIALRVAATFLALVAGLMLLRSGRPVAVKSAPPDYLPRQWSRAILPFSMLAFLGVAHAQVDIFLLGLLAPSDQLGVYKVARAVAALVVFAQAAFNAALAPRFAALHAASDLAGLERLARSAVRWELAVTVPIAVVLVGAGRPLLDLVYGEAYLHAALPLAILCIGQVIGVSVGSSALILNMAGYERRTLRVSVAMAIISPVLMLALVPWAGVVGAAVASALSIIVLNGALFWQVRHWAGINPGIYGRAIQHG